jgi:hypothetical protein
MGRPSRSSHRYSSPAHSAATGAPDRAQPGDVVAQPAVGRQLLGEHLGEATAEHEARRARWQLLVPQRVDDGDVGAGRGQQLGGLGVGEGERRRRRPRRRPAGRARRDGRRPRVALERRRGPRDPQDRVEVEAAGAQLAEAAHRRHRRGGALGGGDEPEVAARRRHVVVRRRTPSTGARPSSARAAAARGGRCRPGSARRRRAARPRRSRSRARAQATECDIELASTTRTTGAPSSAATCAVEPSVRAAAPVVQPHHPLDDRDVGAAGAVQQQRSQPVGPTSTGSRLRPGRPVASAW